MINYQKDIIAQFKTAITAIGTSTFKEVGEYPFDVPNIGSKYPAALVEDGNEDKSSVEIQRNQSVTMDYLVPVWLYTQINQTRIATILDYQVAIEDAILDDSMLTALGVKIDCISLLGVEKGDRQEPLDMYSVGYDSNISIRKINFVVTFTTAR